jgi:hypothetical protein
MKIGMNQLQIYLVIKDYDTGLLLGVNKDGEYFTTDDIFLAKKWGNKKVATDFRDRHPLQNWELVFARIKLTKKQDWYEQRKHN